jgi:hypothetical protein
MPHLPFGSVSQPGNPPRLRKIFSLSILAQNMALKFGG